MAQSQRRWDVVYEQVDLQTHTTVQKFAAQNVMENGTHGQTQSQAYCLNENLPNKACT